MTLPRTNQFPRPSGRGIGEKPIGGAHARWQVHCAFVRRPHRTMFRDIPVIRYHKTKLGPAKNCGADFVSELNYCIDNAAALMSLCRVYILPRRHANATQVMAQKFFIDIKSDQRVTPHLLEGKGNRELERSSTHWIEV